LGQPGPLVPRGDVVVLWSRTRSEPFSLVCIYVVERYRNANNFSVAGQRCVQSIANVFIVASNTMSTICHV